MKWKPYDKKGDLTPVFSEHQYPPESTLETLTGSKSEPTGFNQNTENSGPSLTCHKLRPFSSCTSTETIENKFREKGLNVLHV